MCSSAASFGAPVTEPGGNVARDELGPAHPGPQPALDRGHEVEQARVRFDGTHSAGYLDRADSHTRPRSLRTRSTIITFSARSLARKPSAVAAVPLIGD